MSIAKRVATRFLQSDNDEDFRGFFDEPKPSDWEEAKKIVRKGPISLGKLTFSNTYVGDRAYRGGGLPSSDEKVLVVVVGLIELKTPSRNFKFVLQRCIRTELEKQVKKDLKKILAKNAEDIGFRFLIRETWGKPQFEVKKPKWSKVVLKPAVIEDTIGVPFRADLEFEMVSTKGEGGPFDKMPDKELDELLTDGQEAWQTDEGYRTITPRVLTELRKYYRDMSPTEQERYMDNLQWFARKR